MASHFSVPASADLVLVVDDDDALLRVMQRQLGAMGVRCEVASNPAQALEVVETLQPTVLLSDYAMPGLDGLTLLRRAGDISPGSVRVLMTAHADEQVLERALNEAHAEFFLPKPFTGNQLRGLLARALRRGDVTRQGEALLATTSAERLQLDVIARAQREVLVSRSLDRAMAVMLDGVLDVTGSHSGVIGETAHRADGAVYLRVLASHPVEDGRLAALEAEEVDDLLRRASETGQPVIVNGGNVQKRGRAAPSMRSLAALPFVEGGDVVGMVVARGRPGGYTPELISTLEPFLQTGTTLIQREAAEHQHGVTEQALAHERLRLQATFDAALDGLVIVDKEGQIRQVNPSLCAMFGYDASELLGERLDVLMPPELREPYLDRLGRHSPERETSVVNAQERTVGLRKDGGEFPIELSVVLIDDPVRGHSFAGTVRDLTEVWRQERALRTANDELAVANAQLKRLARTDGLTGLSNRRYFDETLESELHRSHRAGTRFALVICDIDHFKELNDQLGHQAGDDYLRRLARTLEGSFRRSGELVARWGGEEFALLVPHVPTPDTAERLGERLLRAVRDADLPRPRCSTGDRLTVSVGVAWCEGGKASVDELLRVADDALYQAKREGRDRSVEVQVGGARPQRIQSV